jgi:hypothetical protein
MMYEVDRYGVNSNGQESPSGLATLHHDMSGDDQGKIQRIVDFKPRQLESETHIEHHAYETPERTTVGSRHMRGVHLGITTGAQ